MQGLLIWSIVNYVLGILLLCVDISFFDDYRGQSEIVSMNKRIKLYLFFPLWGSEFLPLLFMYLIVERVKTLWSYYKRLKNRYLEKTFIKMYEEYNEILEEMVKVEGAEPSSEKDRQLYELKLKAHYYEQSICYLDL